MVNIICMYAYIHAHARSIWLRQIYPRKTGKFKMCVICRADFPPFFFLLECYGIPRSVIKSKMSYLNCCFILLFLTLFSKLQRDTHCGREAKTNFFSDLFWWDSQTSRCWDLCILCTYDFCALQKHWHASCLLLWSGASQPFHSFFLFIWHYWRAQYEPGTMVSKKNLTWIICILQDLQKFPFLSG